MGNRFLLRMAQPDPSNQQLGGVLGVVLNVSRRAKQQSEDAQDRATALREELTLCTQSRDDERRRVSVLEQQVIDLQQQLADEKSKRAEESNRYSEAEAKAQNTIDELSVQLTAADQVFQELVQESVALLQRLPVNRAEAQMIAATEDSSGVAILEYKNASVDQLQALLNDLQTLKAAEAAKAAENVAGLTTQLRQQTLSFAVALRKAQAGSTSLQPGLESSAQLKLLGNVVKYVSANIALVK